MSDHSDVDMGDVGIYSPLSNRQQPAIRPAFDRATSSGSDFVPDPFEKRLLAEIEYRESRSHTAEFESRPDMNGYANTGAMEPPRFVQVIAPARAVEGAEVQLFGRVSGNPYPSVSIALFHTCGFEIHLDYSYPYLDLLDEKWQPFANIFSEAYLPSRWRLCRINCPYGFEGGYRQLYGRR